MADDEVVFDLTDDAVTLTPIHTKQESSSGVALPSNQIAVAPVDRSQVKVESSSDSSAASPVPSWNPHDVVMEDEDLPEPVPAERRTIVHPPPSQDDDLPPLIPLNKQPPKQKKKRKRIAEEEDGEQDAGGSNEEHKSAIKQSPSGDGQDEHNSAIQPSENESKGGTGSEESSPSKLTKKKRTRPDPGEFKLKTHPSVAPQMVTPDPSAANDVELLKKMLENERQTRTGWIPSMMRAPAAALDAQETLAAARAQVLGKGNEIAERRESNDAFLVNLAAKYVKHRSPKKRVKKEEAATGEFSAAAAGTAGDEDGGENSAAAEPSAPSTPVVAPAPAKKSRARKPKEPPSDMDFLMLQEKLKREVWKKKE